MRKLTQRHFIAHGERKTWRRKQAGDKHYSQVSVSCFHFHPPLSHRPLAPSRLSERHEARGERDCFVCRTCYNSIITALRQTLSPHSSEHRKIMFPEAENTFRSDFCSLSGCHSVCLEPQNSQSEAARLTIWGLQDCLVWAARLTILKAFLLVSDNQQARQKKKFRMSC